MCQYLSLFLSHYRTFGNQRFLIQQPQNLLQILFISLLPWKNLECIVYMSEMTMDDKDAAGLKHSHIFIQTDRGGPLAISQGHFAMAVRRKDAV